MSSQRSTPARHWCFTHQGKEAPKFGIHCRYLVYQLECGKETKKEHWQGYAEFDRPMRRAAAIISLDILGAHLEVRKSKRSKVKQLDAAVQYCMKKETRVSGPHEFGEWNTNQGNRMDYHKVSDMVKNGETDKTIAETHPNEFMRMHRGIAALRTALQKIPERNWKPEVILLSGKSGSGKSYLAHKMAPKAFRKGKTEWWDGYAGHEDIILDDFRPAWWSAEYMFQLLDPYPMRVQVKGGFTDILAKRIIITSIIPIEEWWKDEDPEQLTRRIDKIITLGRWDAMDDVYGENKEKEIFPDGPIG